MRSFEAILGIDIEIEEERRRENMKDDLPNCAQCPFDISVRLCRKEDGKAPSFCPTLNKSELTAKCLEEYERGGKETHDIISLRDRQDVSG